MGSAENSLDISRDFLANALGKEFEITEYKVKSGTKPGDNFMSLIYSAEVKGKIIESGDEVTRNLLLKCYPVHPTRQEFNNKSNIFFKELEIYRLWMPELTRFQTEVIGLDKPIKLPYAPFVSGKCVDYASTEGMESTGKPSDPLENHIIMDDLRTSGYQMTNRRDSMDIDHLRLVIYELAKVHALSWVYKSKVEQDVCKKFPCLNNGFNEDDKELFSKMIENNVQQASVTLEEMLGAGNKLSQALLAYQDKLDPLFDVFMDLQDDFVLDSLLRVKPDGRFGKDSSEPVLWRIISHGDCWSNNMLFRYDEKTKKPLEVVLVDLQMVRECCVMPDLVYVIYACTDAELRKKHMEEIMKLYVDTFNQICETMKTETLPGFNLESFKYRFHRFKPLGLMMALSLLPIMLKEDDVAVAMDLEKMDHNKDMNDMFSDICKTSGSNTLYNERLLGVVQELYDEGVI